MAGIYYFILGLLAECAGQPASDQFACHRPRQDAIGMTIAQYAPGDVALHALPAIVLSGGFFQRLC